MKNISRLSLAVIAMFLVMAFTSINSIRYIEPIELTIKTAQIDTVVPKLKPIKIVLETNKHVDFLKAIGHKESGNRYDIVNRFGYMGRYQFGKKTLRGLGFKISQEEFLNSPQIQEKAMYALLKQNKRSLRKHIEKYNGMIVHGVLVTESGLLAAAHLGGAGSVKKWFRTGKVRKDGNGVKITTYMTKFSGYQLVLP